MHQQENSDFFQHIASRVCLLLQPLFHLFQCKFLEGSQSIFQFSNERKIFYRLDLFIPVYSNADEAANFAVGTYIYRIGLKVFWFVLKITLTIALLGK